MSTSIEEIPLPEDLNGVDVAEFTAYKMALIDLEIEFQQLKENTNPDQQTCISIINEIKDKRIAEADERLKLKLEIIDKQTEKEHEKLQKEKQAYNEQLFDRILRSYYQAYTSITSQLKELMGKDYAQYIAVNSIEFPTIPSENQMRTRMQQPEDVKIRIAPAEADNDYRRIQQILTEATQ